MRTRQRKLGRLLLGIVLISCMAATAFAHDMWVEMENFRPEKGSQAKLGLAYGHLFVLPSKDFIEKERVEQVYFLTPCGKNKISAVEGETSYASEAALQGSGTYMAVAEQKGGFATKTVEGYQRGKCRKDIKDPKDIIYCKYSEKFSKALFTVGAPSGDVYSKVLGFAMEIVPLDDPAKLKKGDILRVKVLSKGNPVRGFVYGTFNGFSDQSNTFAYTTYTDKEGIAKIKIIEEGPWLLVAKQEVAYPDATECDKMSTAATLTFAVK